MILTSCRVICVNKKSSAFKAFDLPLSLISNEGFAQPIFGANYIHGTCKPLLNSLPGDINFKIWFMTGGCGTFAPAYLKMVASCRRNRGRGAEPSAYNSYQNAGQRKMAYIDPNDPSVIYLQQPEIAQNINYNPFGQYQPIPQGPPMQVAPQQMPPQPYPPQAMPQQPYPPQPMPQQPPYQQPYPPQQPYPQQPMIEKPMHSQPINNPPPQQAPYNQPPNNNYPMRTPQPQYNQNKAQIQAQYDNYEYNMKGSRTPFVDYKTGQNVYSKRGFTPGQNQYNDIPNRPPSRPFGDISFKGQQNGGDNYQRYNYSNQNNYY